MRIPICTRRSPRRPARSAAWRCASILGEGADGLTLAHGAVTPSRTVLAGAREYEPAEEDAAIALGLTTLEATDLADPDALAAAVAATGASAVYIHVDLDVLDPAAMSGVTASVPFGVPLADLLASISRAARGAAARRVEHHRFRAAVARRRGR